MVVHVCNPIYLGDKGRRLSNSRPAQAKGVRPALKDKIPKG
jgi:hypothetical protein